MNTFCKSDCCSVCPMLGQQCPGCEASDGHPCGGVCVAAECIRNSGWETYCALRDRIVEEVNALGIAGLEISELHLLNGAFVNLAYPLPNGQQVKLLEEKKVYLGNQVERPGTGRCYGLVADETHLLVCAYGENGSDPEIILYQKRT